MQSAAVAEETEAIDLDKVSSSSSVVANKTNHPSDADPVTSSQTGENKGKEPVKCVLHKKTSKRRKVEENPRKDSDTELSSSPVKKNPNWRKHGILSTTENSSDDDDLDGGGDKQDGRKQVRGGNIKFNFLKKKSSNVDTDKDQNHENPNIISKCFFPDKSSSSAIVARSRLSQSSEDNQSKKDSDSDSDADMVTALESLSSDNDGEVSHSPLKTKVNTCIQDVELEVRVLCPYSLSGQ
jgi:hypothetical protein